jgi:uncharacterized protein (TIGR02147 family)
MDAFEHKDYRSLIRARIAAYPKKGHGQLSRLASTLGVSSALISQVLGGDKNLSEEQACQAAEHFGFSEPETIYFLTLVQLERAGTPSLRRIHESQAALLRENASRVRGRVKPEKELTFEQQAVFYSHWLFTAVHTLSSIPAFQYPDAMATHLRVPLQKVREVATWLVEHSLCVEKDGKLLLGPASTMTDRDSLLASRHHANWRQRALETMSRFSPQDFFFTASFSISERDYSEFRKQLVQLIDGLAKRVGETTPEELAVINVDFFKG